LNRLDFDVKTVKKYGFNQVYKLKKGEEYTGSADRVMLVFSRTQLMSADLYRKAHYPGLKTDIAVCEDPNVQREQLGERSAIYHFNNL
jgi:hypothetical protein